MAHAGLFVCRPTYCNYRVVPVRPISTRRQFPDGDEKLASAREQQLVVLLMMGVVIYYSYFI